MLLTWFLAILIWGFLILIVCGTPTKFDNDRWMHAKQEGIRLFSEFKEMGISPDDLEAYPPEVQTKILEEMGYDIEAIDDFMVLLDRYPDILKPPQLVDRWWLGYKRTRQSIRRFPGYNPKIL